MRYAARDGLGFFLGLEPAAGGFAVGLAECGVVEVVEGFLEHW